MTDDDLPDLRTWRVPPPPPLDASGLVMRALSPATTPVRRPRLRWLVASLVLVNVALAALLVIVLVRPPAPPQTVVVPAGGPTMDARVHELLARLADEQAQLEKKLAELSELRALVQELSDKVAKCEQERTVAKQPPGPGPAPAPAPVAAPRTPEIDTSCDEVSCVLNNYPSGCCDKYKKTPPVPPPAGTPDFLDREAISSGIASIKDAVRGCAAVSSAKGVVKARVRVGGDGRVMTVEITATPDAPLGRCVASAMQRAVFQRTKQGGSFTYPFVF